MKNRFNTYDIMSMVTELQRLIGMRVNQVYDIDNKTYVIRLQRSEEKCVLLLESANRFHTTQFEWPKNMAPSGFTMKLRKHLKNKRLESLQQIGIDRVVDFQFGSGLAAYHVILELYDRGNIVLTDHEWVILNVLRPHVEGDKVRFAVKEKYPLDRAKTSYQPPPIDELSKILASAKPGDNLKKVLNPHLEYGAAVIDHILLENGLSGTMKLTQESGKGTNFFHVKDNLDTLASALQQGELMMTKAMTEVSKGYIIQKKEERPNPDGEGASFLITNVEFHPKLFAQHQKLPNTEYETFDRSVDEFFSTLEGQKIDMKTVQVEREAMKKLQNVRKDHEKRLSELEHVQAVDRHAADLITRNEPLVEQARLAVQAAIANQMPWDDIKLLVKTAQDNKDPIASIIKHLKLDTNHITLLLSDPYDEELAPMCVDIDLSLTAFANARRYYDQKRNAAKKQQKTIESAGKALKSAERKTKQTLKEAHTVSNIIKARKTYWFEKFFWFISSDNYLVIGGRDQQQNELLVKRYLRSTDLYVHADLSGASSIIIKNPNGGEVPPKTLNEAGQAAVAYSVAWEAKVLTRAWWVHANQVSKSAPTGEYLTTGSFMIRGKKNYLLTEHLQFGFSFMFRLEDSCIDRHRDERKSIVQDEISDVTSVQDQEDVEIVVSDDDEASDKEEKSPTEKTFDTIPEETDELKDTTTKDQTETQDAKDNKSEEDSKLEKDNGSEKDNDSKEDSNSSDSEITDTHIMMDHYTGEVVILRSGSQIDDTITKAENQSTALTFPALPNKSKKPQKDAKEQKVNEDKNKEEKGVKRGQKGKLKKIKEKYKDQDDEDRALALQILQSGKAEKDSKKALKKAAAAKANKGRPGGKGTPKIPQPAPLILEAESDPEEPEQDAEPEVEQTGPDADAEMLCQLTGSPFTEDELLFAVPVVAPYSALHNYKFKVKLTPGNSKRGKAAKTAIQVFLRDKAGSAREKDLLKAVKEENVARNFPGKVKLSAPQLHKHKK